MNTIADALAYLNGDLSAAHRLDTVVESEEAPKVSVSLPADVNVEFKILPPTEDEEPFVEEHAEEEESVDEFPLTLETEEEDEITEDDTENEARFLTLDDLK